MVLSLRVGKYLGLLTTVARHGYYIYFANFTTSKNVIWVVTRLGWQIEGDGKASLAFSEIGAVQLVGRFCG